MFCPIYNLSDKEVVLRAGDPIALMDFVTTTPFNPTKSKEHPRPPKRILLDEYGAEELKSVLYTEAKKRIDEIRAGAQSRIASIESKEEFFIGVSLVVNHDSLRRPSGFYNHKPTDASPCVAQYQRAYFGRCAQYCFSCA